MSGGEGSFDTLIAIGAADHINIVGDGDTAVVESKLRGVAQDARPCCGPPSPMFSSASNSRAGSR